MQFYKASNYQSFISKQGLALGLLAIIISLSSALLVYTEKTAAPDWLLYDQAMQFSLLPASDDIVIIDIDDKSLGQIGRWPWPREIHAQLLDKLSEAKTKAIVFDVLFPELDAENYTSDLAFSQAIQRNGTVILPIYLETLGQQGQVIESPPHALFYKQVKALGHVHLNVEQDGVVRGVFLKEGVGTPYWPHLSLALLRSLSDAPSDKLLTGARADIQSSNSSGLGIARDFYNLLPMPASAQGLRHYSYSDILQGVVDLNALHGKVVFIGATAAGLGDVLATPIGSMNGVELNAWIFQALRSDQMIQTIPATSLAVITFLSVLAFVLVLGRLSPGLFLVFSVCGLIGVLSISVVLLLLSKLWLPPTSTMMGIAVFFPLWSWLRAESLLRFLRKEIEDLSKLNHSFNRGSAQEMHALTFLERIGVLDSATQQATQKGEQILQALHLDGEQVPPLDFWQQQLGKYSQHKASSASKSFQGVEVVARTISQLTTIKENDQKNRQLIEKSLSQLQDAVCITDLCGNITFTNKRFKQWFLMHQSLDDLFAILAPLTLKSGLAWVQAISKVYQTNTLFSDEVILHGERTQQFLCQVSLVSINEAFKDTLILSFTDITQLKAAENARTEALSFLSHDLRSPMVSVLAILDRYRPANTKQHYQLPDASIAHIESLVRKNLDYAESFLQLSKADALAEANMHPCDLHAVLDAAQVQASALAAPKLIQVQTQRCEEDAWVLGDIDLLERALNNLISNAVKFSPAGSLLSLALLKHDQTLEMSVADHGVGIDKQDQAALFDRFTRAKNAASTDGAGLGLNFVATVAKKHNGRVTVKSVPNHGSKFTLHLPALNEQEIFDA